MPAQHITMPTLQVTMPTLQTERPLNRLQCLLDKLQRQLCRLQCLLNKLQSQLCKLQCLLNTLQATLNKLQSSLKNIFKKNTDFVCLIKKLFLVLRLLFTLKEKNMTDYQNARQTSLTLIVKEGKNFPEAISLIPKFERDLKRIEVISSKITEIGIQQAKDIKGVKTDKDLLIEHLIDSLSDMSGAIHSFAEEKGDKALQTRVHYTDSIIDRMSLADFTKAIGIVIEEADKIAPEELADEGITAAELAEFKADYAKLMSTSTDTREAIIDRSSYTQQLEDLFDEAATIKKQTLDKLVRQFQRKAPEFYQKYMAASTVIYKRSAKKTAPAPEAAK
jgi:hypothetical protein